MKLIGVTITGADDDVAISDLRQLTQQFPFVEWGILVRHLDEPGPRFPSRGFLATLATACRHGSVIPFSLHLCGTRVRSLFKFAVGGRPVWDKALEGLPWQLAQRVQVNWTGYEKQFDSLALLFPQLDEEGFQNVILQVNERMQLLASASCYVDQRIQPLLDASGGRGVEVEDYKLPFPATYWGVSGGLSPENIGSKLAKMDDQLPDEQRIWVDVETGVRSGEDRGKFDLDKVQSFLETCARWSQGRAGLSGV